MESESKKKEITINEKRIREITFIYYSRPDIKKAIFDFSQNRECIPRYFEGFGKRPDIFQYEGDILEQVKRGATSFHCSEELWKDPLEISTEMSRQELDSVRIGWDLLLDIDSPYLEYSKIYAELLIQVLKLHGVENIGVKYSGSKGFHIIIPWKAFPKEIYKQKTKDMFPEWPRIICEYLSSIVKEKLEDKLYDLQGESLVRIAEKAGKNKEDLIIRECVSCKRPATKKHLITFFCPYCKTERIMQPKTRRVLKCPDCSKELIEKKREEIYVCEFCNFNSEKNPEMFEEKRLVTEHFIEADLILVSPRHLFRMPYSLHEKTTLSSIVIDKDKIKNFQITDAKPFKIEIKNFYPDAKEAEAKNLLLQALDWQEQIDKQEKLIQEKRFKSTGQENRKISKLAGLERKKISIPNPTEDILPPCIRLLSKGIKQDGRKRALFLLLNFYTSIGVPYEEIEKRIFEWNEKNYSQLKKGYIQSQINWYIKNTARMPPNCDKTNYRDLNVCKPDELCKRIKNPVNYSVKKYFSFKK